MKSWDFPSDSRYWRIAVYPSILISVVAFFIIVVSIALTTDYFLKSDYRMAGTIIAIGSSSSTILLVVLTGWYTSLTRELVSQAEKDRKQRRELRRKDRSEEWYGDLLFHLRMIQQIWDRGFARPKGVTDDGEVFVSLKSDQQLWRELGSHFENIPRIVSQRPAHVDEDVAERANQIHINWIMMTDIDVGGEPEDPRVFYSNSLFQDIEELEEQIVEISARH